MKSYHSAVEYIRLRDIHRAYIRAGIPPPYLLARLIQEADAKLGESWESESRPGTSIVNCARAL